MLSAQFNYFHADSVCIHCADVHQPTISRHDLIYHTVRLYKRVYANRRAARLVLVKAAREHSRTRLWTANAMQHQPLRAQRRTYLIALILGCKCCDYINHYVLLM